MGIKCSLLGHSFTGTSVEEEREEQGSEVVITIKEVETCDRCGKTRVVSENKEVRSIESASAVEDAEPEPEPAPESATSEPTGAPAGGPSPSPDIDAAEDDAELIEEAESTETEADPTADPEPDTASTTGGPEETTPAREPVDTTADTGDAGADAAESHEDDAVILDDEDEEPEREPGEWPEETRREDPGEAVDATDTAEWPDEDGGDDDEWEPSESLTREIDEAEVKPAGSATITVPEGEFECAECGFRTDVEASSLRAGDFCPECKTGTLEHRNEE